jgi:hypothetical protein
VSFLSPNQLHELAVFASFADKEARSDLAGGYIKDENDYTSNFTGALRRIINSNSQSGLVATSHLLSHSEERQTGADAAVILSKGKQSKVAVFEGKWPRFAKVPYRWDRHQTASGLSHFSDQLDRQRRWSGIFAIFEMFYCEFPFGKQPPFLDDDGSSCIWYDDAEAFRSSRNQPNALWSQQELSSLLQLKRVTIRDVLMEFGECKKGTPIGLTDPHAIGREFSLPQQVLAVAARGESERRR